MCFHCRVEEWPMSVNIFFSFFCNATESPESAHKARFHVPGSKLSMAQGCVHGDLPQALTASFHQLFCLIWARSFQAICRPFVLLVICCYLEMVIKPAKNKSKFCLEEL